MKNTILIQDIAQKKHAIVGFQSMTEKVYFYPDSFLCGDDFESYLSVRQNNKNSNIQLHMRLYTSGMDYEPLVSYSLLYDNPEKIVHSNFVSVPVKSSRKDAFVTRICFEVPFIIFRELIQMKEVILSNGNKSRVLKISSNNTNQVKLLLFLASCFGVDQLQEEEKGLIASLIEEEENADRIIQQEEKLKIELERKERIQKEDEIKQRQKEKAEAERIKREKEESKQRDDAKKMVKAIWTEYHSRKDVDDVSKRFLSINYENNTYVLSGYLHSPIWGEPWRENILELGGVRNQILSQLDFLKKIGLIHSYTCAENYIGYNPHSISISLSSTHIDYNDYCYIGICSLQQLEDIIDGEYKPYSILKKILENDAGVQHHKIKKETANQNNRKRSTSQSSSSTNNGRTGSNNSSLEDITTHFADLGKSLKDAGNTGLKSAKEGLAEGLSQISESIKNSSNKQSSGGCYIATCVYGSYDCPEVWTLRRFRDQTLKNSKLGRAFIKVYYATSPTLVKWFGSSRFFLSFWRRNLDKLVVRLNRMNIDGSPYIDV